MKHLRRALDNDGAKFSGEFVPRNPESASSTIPDAEKMLPFRKKNTTWGLFSKNGFHFSQMPINTGK